MSYNEISGVSFGGDLDVGADIAQELRAALSGVSFGDDGLGEDIGDDLLGELADMGADSDLLGAVADEIGRRRSRRRPMSSAQRRRHMAGLARRAQGMAPRPVTAPALAQALTAANAANHRHGAQVLGGFGPVSAFSSNARPDAMGGRVLPITSASIAAGAIGTITLNPQDAFRAERLVYGGPAGTFSITQINIKNVPQLVSTGEVPADMFAPNAADLRLNFTPCPVGGQIQIQVLNFSGAAAIFRGGFAGSAAIQV